MRSLLPVMLLIFASVAAAEDSPFFAQVKLGFPAWDLDDNDELSAEEIERALDNPAIRGDAAAAVAALRRAVRADKDLSPLKLEQIAAHLQDAKPPRYESLFETARAKIQKTNRELYPDGALNLETLSQGHLGDCFLLVSLGTAAHRDPDRLRKFMQPAPDRKVQVTLGNGRRFVIDAPTDAELAIGATTRDTGIWAATYEKAIGTVLLERSTSGRHAAPFSLIGVGGSPHRPLEILTGKKIRRHGCELYRNATDDDGASADDLDPLRANLKEAFAAGRLMVGGCGPIGTQTIVPGIYYNHSYGVLDYDATTDQVLFWNPFGNKYTPQGPPGLKTGYVTSHGKFRAPLKEAVMWFGSFSIETEEAAD